MTKAASPPIRDAATLILVRDMDGTPSVLMGQRGSRAAFMPSKFVFPGGALDPADSTTPLASPLAPEDAAALSHESAVTPDALVCAAVRELFEETGQRLTAPAPQATHWAGLRGHAPNGAALKFIFRAITPPERPRRFDARFFIADAGHLSGDPDDFSGAEDELSHLRWVPLAQARKLDVPFITDVVLAEVSARLRDPRPRPVPFFDNSGASSVFRHLGG